MKSASITQNKLLQIYNLSDGDIPCKPVQRIVENEVIIGIITETNQMVPVQPEAYISPPGGVHVDNIKTIRVNNINEPISYPLVDQYLLTDDTVDIERITKIKQIRLESHFYNVFRNLMRIVVSYTKHKSTKQEIQQIIASPIELYYDKLLTIERLLNELLNEYLIFAEYDLDTINSLSQIEQCISLEDGDCNQNSICALSDEASENGICKLILPKLSLINGRDNEVEYFAKLANELINYPQIKNFIFNPSKFLSFQNTTYNLNQNEIILLEGILYNNYFDGIVIDKKNENINNITTWSTATPSSTFPYSDSFDISYKFKPKRVSNCIVLNKPDKKLKMGILKERGLEDYNIIEYKHNNNCSWELLADIISAYTNTDTTVNEVVDKLVSMYSIYLRDGFDITMGITIDDFLRTMGIEGKRDQSRAIKTGTNLKDIITPIHYHITALDMCAISELYNIPIILACRTPIPYLGLNYIAFSTEKALEKCIIVLSSSYKSVNSKTGLVLGCISKNETSLLSIAELGNTFNEFTKNNINSVAEYLAFSKEKYKTEVIKRSKKKVKLIIGSKPQKKDTIIKVKKRQQKNP